MWWIVLLIIIGFTIIFPAFRKILLVLSGFVLVIAAVYYLYSQREQSLSKQRIKPHEIEINNLVIENSQLIGRIRNKSERYVLGTVKLKLTFKDCIKSNCEIIGEDFHWIFTNVPPGQARDFGDYISLSRMKPRGVLEWEYSITEIKGSKE